MDINEVIYTILFLLGGTYTAGTIKTILADECRLAQLTQPHKFIRKSPISKLDVLPTISDFQGKEELLSFYRVLSAMVEPQDLANFVRNFKDVTITRKKASILWGCLGSYDVHRNVLNIAKENTLPHEAFHLSSSEWDKKQEFGYMGFKQANTTTCIGSAMNEGYTELLTARKFQDGRPSTYCTMVRNMKLIELLFPDAKELEHLYFSHDLFTTIEKLEDYASFDDVIHLILEMDSAMHYSGLPLNPTSILKYAKIEFTLYNWLLSKNPSVEQERKFRNIICEDKIYSLIFALYNKKISKKDATDMIKENQVTSQYQKKKIIKMKND